jgi:hypothetical protein
MRKYLLEMSSMSMSMRSSIRRLSNPNTSKISVNKSYKRGNTANVTDLDGSTIESIELPLHCGLATGWVMQGISGDELKYGVMNLGETFERARGLMRMA